MVSSFIRALLAIGLLASQRVEELLSQPSSLRLELHNSIEERVRYGVRVGCYGARQFWNGTLVSNTLQFPPTTSPGPARIPANGRTVNDLRMSVTVVRNEVGHPELDVCIQNTGLREYILPFGQSGFGYPSAVRMYVRKPNEASASMFRWGAGRAATQIESIPMVVPVLPRSDYRVRTPPDKWRMPAPDGRSLQELIRQRLFLYLEFRVRSDEPHRYLNVDCFPVSIRIYERIHDEMHLPDSRFRIEHAHDVPPDRILLYAKAGVIASIQPPLLSHIDIRTANGAPAPQNLFPCMRLLDAGVKIVMGTDAIGASPLTSIFEVIQTALTRPGPDGRVLTLEQCLRAYTLDAAYAEFGEKEKGSIEPGKLADLVLLDRDIFSSPVSTLDQTKYSDS
jgi:hypothetical protein